MEKIEISDIKLENNEIDIEKIYDSLNQPQCTIKVIKISSLDLPKQIAKLLKKALAKNKSVTELQCQNFANDDLDYLKALKQSSTIRNISIEAPHAKLARYLKGNYTITSISISEHQRYEDTLEALSQIGTLERVNLTFLGVIITNLSALFKGNKGLKHIQLNVKICSFDDVEASKALQQLSALTTLHIEEEDVPRIGSLSQLVLALPENSKLMNLTIPEHYLNDTKNREAILQKIKRSLKSLKTLKFVPKGDVASIVEISRLFKPSSPIRVLTGDIRHFVTDKFLEVVSTSTSLRKIWISTRGVFFDNIIRLLQATADNYALDVDLAPSAIEYVDLRVAVNSYRTVKQERLNKLTLLLNQLRTILLPADRGLFACIPEEILFSIYQKVTYQLIGGIEFTDKQLWRVFEVARLREVLPNQDQGKFVADLWKELFM